MSQIWEQFYTDKEPNQCDTSKLASCSGNVLVDRANFKNLISPVIKIEHNSKVLVSRSKFISIYAQGSNLPGACILIKTGECVQYRICAYNIYNGLTNGNNLGGFCRIIENPGKNKIIESSFSCIKAYMGALYLNSTSGSIEIKSINSSHISAELDSHFIFYIVNPKDKSTISFSYFCSSVSKCRSTYHSKAQYVISHCKYKNNTDTMDSKYRTFPTGILYFEEMPHSTSTVTHCIIIENKGPFVGIDNKSNAFIVFQDCNIQEDKNYPVNNEKITRANIMSFSFVLSFKYLDKCSNYYTGELNYAYKRGDVKWKLAWNLK